MSAAASAVTANPSASIGKNASCDTLSAHLEKRSTSSNGESMAPSHATSLLNLEVKVLTQALGVENQWVERGDGRVEFVELTIRVLSSVNGRKDEEEGGDENSNGAGAAKAAGDDASSASTVEDSDLAGDTVILEDTITCDTPFVGENCCIVWNSFEQQLSLCLMYASEEGYSASWSALVALQEKAYPLLRFDLLESCRTAPSLGATGNGETRGSEGRTVPESELKDTKVTEDTSSIAAPNSLSLTVPATEPLPYSYFIHTLYDPPLGFIEMHALSLSLLENHHTSQPRLFESRETVVDMLRLASADLLDHLLTPEVFPRVMKGLSPASSSTPLSLTTTEGSKPAAASAQQSTKEGGSDDDESEDVPEALAKLEVPENLASFIAKEKRLRKLQQLIIPTLANADDAAAQRAGAAAAAATTTTTTTTPSAREGNGGDLVLKLSAMTHRLRNEVVCTLLSSDTTLLQARDALTVAPPVSSGPPGGSPASSTQRARTSSSSSGQSNRGADRTPSPSSAPSVGLPPSANISEAQRVEKSVLAHLRFFRSLMVISMIELGRELVGPVIAKIYHFGLLEALSLVAERFAMPAGSTAVFLAKVREMNVGGSGGAAINGEPNTTQPFPPSTSSSANRNSLSTNSTNMNSSVTNMGSSAPVYYSPAIEVELTAFLDATLVRLNERQEERLMNELVRAPILADPVKYNGLMTFALRQVLFANTHCGGMAGGGSVASPPFRSPLPPSHAHGATPAGATNAASPAALLWRYCLRDTAGVRNTLLLFHLLGLHDDEGSATMERALDPQGTDVRDRFHSFVLDTYLALTMRGQVAIPPPPSMANAGGAGQGGGGGGGGSVPLSTNSRGVSVSTSSNGASSPKKGMGSPIVVFSNALTPGGAAGGGGVGTTGVGVGAAAHHHEFATSLTALPAGISPGLISVLNYLVQLCGPTNRDRVLRLIFDSKSNVLAYMETCCSIAVNTKAKTIGLDVLASQVRFLKCILTEVGNSCGDDPDGGSHSPGGDSNPLPRFDTPDPLPANLVALICRQLTVERDTLWYYLRAFNALGGRRRNTVFHSSFLALLELIARGPMPRGEPPAPEEVNRRVVSEETTFHDLRSFVFMKYQPALPERFAKKVGESLLAEVCARLGFEDAFSSCNNSTSALSSTIGSELLKSSTKLRFVDELEAATGGLDGSVSPTTVTALTPAVMASMSAEEKRRKMSAGARNTTLEAKLQSGTANTSPLRTTTTTTGTGAAMSSPPTLTPLQGLMGANPSASNALPGGRLPLTPPKKSIGAGSASPSSASAAQDAGAVTKRLQLSASPPPIVASGAPAPVAASSSEEETREISIATGPGLLQPTAPKGEKPSIRPRKMTGGHEDEPAAQIRRPHSVGSGSRGVETDLAGEEAASALSETNPGRGKRAMTNATTVPRDGSASTAPPTTRIDMDGVDGKRPKRLSGPDAVIHTNVPPLGKTSSTNTSATPSTAATATAAVTGKSKAEAPHLVLPRVRKASD